MTKKWIQVTLILCLFGFLKETKPSQPFVYEFLIGEWRNITAEQVNREIFPLGTYSYLVQLVIIFLVTDVLRYKPIIIVGGCCGIVVWAILLWTTSLLALQILEIFYGTYLASEVAYFAYIFAMVDKTHYQKISSYSRAAIFAGKFFGGLLGQILIYTEAMDYYGLNYITWACQISATAWALLLPRVKNSLYFHQNLAPFDDETIAVSRNTKREKFQNAYILLKSHFKQAYTNSTVLIWSFWYGCELCGYLLVSSYIQLLWNDIGKEEKMLWNGGVDAASTLCNTMVAILAGYITKNRFESQYAFWILVLISIVQGLVVLMSCLTAYLWISYLGYIIFNILFAFLITVASAEIAKKLVEDSFGLVFGVNTMIALSLQTIIVSSFVANNSLNLSIVEQFMLFAFYHMLIGVLLIIVNIFKCIKNKNSIND